MSSDYIYDCAIIGSGPAAHTAGIYLSRGHVKCAMFEGMMAGGIAAGGQLTTTTFIENFPGLPPDTTGSSLMEQMRHQCELFGVDIITETVTKVDFTAKPFKLWTEDKENEKPVLAKTIIIATGAIAKRLHLKGEDKYWQSGISACAICDGAIPIFRDKVILVVGGGDTACEEASFLKKYGSKIILLVRSDKLRASRIMSQRVTNDPKIEILYNTVALEALGDGELLNAVRVKNVKTEAIIDIKCAGLFYAIGHSPNTENFKDAIKTNSAGFIELKPNQLHTTQETNIPGVYAAGDVCDQRYRQAITAAGSGCQAALDCLDWLEQNK